VGVTGSGGVTEFATVEALARKGLLRDKESSADCHGGPVHHKRLTEGERVRGDVQLCWTQI